VPTILVTGSTGVIGSRTVQVLASKPGVTVRAAVHSRSPGLQPDNVEVVQVDYDDPETVSAAAEGVDAAFLITPWVPSQVDLARRVLMALSAAGVPRLVRLSSIGADREDPPMLMREHAETEQHIVASGIPFTFLRPNSYMSNFVAFYSPDPEGKIRLPWGDAGVSLIDPADVAEAAAHVLTTEGHAGNAYTLTGPKAITVSQTAAAISEATGRSIEYVDMPAEAVRQGILAQGMPGPMVDGLLSLFAANRAGETAVVTEALPELTGHPARSFREFARGHSEGWKQG
jgi:uncharacterized protein YbjT (DUF2867 family)